MGLINKLKKLIGTKEDKLKDLVDSDKFEVVDYLPQQIILKEKARLTKDTYNSIKERFSELETNIIIIPWCFDIIAIDNKVVIKCRD